MAESINRSDGKRSQMGRSPRKSIDTAENDRGSYGTIPTTLARVFIQDAAKR